MSDSGKTLDLLALIRFVRAKCVLGSKETTIGADLLSQFVIEDLHFIKDNSKFPEQRQNRGLH